MESETKDYVVLYNPRAEYEQRHKCRLPQISGNGGGEFDHRSVVECEQCAKRWYADVWFKEDYNRKNKWKPLKWYHMRLQYTVRKRERQ